MSEITADNMAIWSKVEMTNPKDTKPFQRSGGFSGTTICPMSIAKRATELFGPLGIGWGIEELENRIEGTEEKKIWFAHVKVWYLHPITKQRGEVTQWGATEFVGKRSSGAFIDEEAAKKSVTDGWTKCMSMLGFSADVHLGKFDDSKYVNDARKRFDEAAKNAESPKSMPTTTAKPAAKAAEVEHTKAYTECLTAITAAATLGRCREIARNIARTPANKFAAGESDALLLELAKKEEMSAKVATTWYRRAVEAYTTAETVPALLAIKSKLRDERSDMTPLELKEMEGLIDRKCLTIPQGELQTAA